MRCGFWSAGLAAIISIAALPADAQPGRPMEIRDLFDIQTLGDVRISPDGTSIAIVIQRAFSAPATFRPYNMFGNDQADIWIMPADGGPVRNITGGARGGIGYWGPVWSPDGKRLALLSTAGGDNVRAYVWTRSSGRLQRLSDRGVDMEVGTEASLIDYWTPLQWVDERRLLVSVLPAG